MRLNDPCVSADPARRPCRPRALVMGLVFLGLAACAGPTLAEGPGDPVLGGVIELLEADLSETVILDWLATIEDKPRTPNAKEMVALRKAGASDAVMRGLLALARGETPAVAEREATVPPAAPAVALEVHPAAEAAEPAASNAAPSADRRSGDFSLGTQPFDKPGASEVTGTDGLLLEGRGAVGARFTVSNVPYWLEGEEPWSLFLYLNGEPLTFVAEGSIFSEKPLRFSKLLKPGKQRLMLFREQHDGDDNVHFTRVMPQALEFELAPGGSAEIEVAFKQTVISSRNPVSYRVAQNGRLVAESGELGGAPDRWEWLCEDLERTLDGEDDSRLEGCVRWRDLWTGYPDGPTRSQVLQAFANFDYRPVPRGQNLH